MWLVVSWLSIQVRLGRNLSALVSNTHIRLCRYMVHGMILVSFQAAADTVIATCMCLLLRRRRTGFHRCVSGYICGAVNESLCLINDLTRRCRAQDRLGDQPYGLVHHLYGLGH
jgi:hypothetical protein